MSTSTGYFPEQRHDSSWFFERDEFDARTRRNRVQRKYEAKDLAKLILEALGPSVWQSSRQTFGYRWKGEDTLDWGNSEDWIRIKLARESIKSHRLQIEPGLYLSWQFLAETSRLRQLEEFYSFHNTATVRCFLHNHPQLIQVLLKARFHLRKHFGPAQIILKVVSDPEVEWEQLFAYICTGLPVNEAQARLDKLDEEWFLDQIDQVDDLFNFNLEFV